MNGLLAQNSLDSFALDGAGGSNIKSYQSGTVVYALGSTVQSIPKA